MGWVVNAKPRPLFPQERPGTHCIVGWVGPKAGLEIYGKYHLHRDSIPGPSSPNICIQEGGTLYGFCYMHSCTLLAAANG
jgi:hypothetical protein